MAVIRKENLGHGIEVHFYTKSFIINGYTVFYDGGDNWEDQLITALRSVMAETYREGANDLRSQIRTTLGV